MENIKKFIFKCPECYQDILVDEKIKQELLKNGCIACGAEIEKSNFKKNNNSSQTLL